MFNVTDTDAIGGTYFIVVIRTRAARRYKHFYRSATTDVRARRYTFYRSATTYVRRGGIPFIVRRRHTCDATADLKDCGSTIILHSTILERLQPETVPRK